MTKTCTRCKRSLPTDAFGHNRARADGLHNECKQCVADRQAARRGALKVKPIIMPRCDHVGALGESPAPCAQPAAYVIRIRAREGHACLNHLDAMIKTLSAA